MDQFIPELRIIIIFVVFGSMRFFNQRWINAHRKGLQGSSQTIDALVDLTGIISLIFAITFLVAYGYDNTWELAIGLFVIAIVVGLILDILIFAIVRNELTLWFVGTLAVWPLMAVLFFEVSWFGAFSESAS